MEDEKYYWDLIRPKLVHLFGVVWGKPKFGINRRQQVSTLFAMRALRRLHAIDGLFKSGFYLESHLLVRAGYEDWLCLAYLLREPGRSRCDDFGEGVYKLDARAYDAFKAISNKAIADRYFGELPKRVAKFSGRPRSKTKALSFAAMADDVGLREVHNFVYAYLSGISHPDLRLNQIFNMSEAVVARIPKRDAKEEFRLSIWFAWFTSRILVLTSREFSIDHEPFVEEYLLPLVANSEVTLETCVFVRERNTASPICQA
jgi:hypothetical protein